MCCISPVKGYHTTYLAHKHILNRPKEGFGRDECLVLAETGFFDIRVPRQSGAKEYHRVTPCSKPHIRDLLGEKHRLFPLSGNRD